MSLIDRSPKPCLHKRTDHQHGTYACYTLDACRCLHCCNAVSVYEQNRKKRNAYGRSNLVDAGPARDHVAALMASGVGLKQIVKKSGVSQGVLWKLVYGKNGGTPSRRVTRATMDRLLTLDPADRTLTADGARVDPTGTRRRLQALACLGWSVNQLAEHAGADRQPFDQAMRGGEITARTAHTIAALYEHLWDTPAPARDHREKISVSRATNRARRESWAPPLAWDDDTIDDPAAGPMTLAADAEVNEVDEVAVARAVRGERLPLTAAEQLAVVRQLRTGDRPWGDERLAHHLGLTVWRVRSLIDAVRAEMEAAA